MSLRAFSWLPAVLVIGVGGAWFMRNLGLIRSMEQRAVLVDEAFGRPGTRPPVETPVDRVELERLRGLHREVLGLRGKMADLRHAAAARANASNVVADLSAQARAAEEQAALTRAILLSQEVSERTLHHAHLANHLVRALIEQGSATIPSSWGEIRRELGNSSRPHRGEAWLAMMESLEHAGANTEQFELIAPGTPVDLQDPMQFRTRLLLRERVPRENPTGGWIRVYGRLSGAVEEVRQSSQDFTAWEQAASRDDLHH